MAKNSAVVDPGVSPAGVRPAILGASGRAAPHTLAFPGPGACAEPWGALGGSRQLFLRVVDGEPEAAAGRPQRWPGDATHEITGRKPRTNPILPSDRNHVPRPPVAAAAHLTDCC